MSRHRSIRIALYNHKGGVGKTTLTANIAAALAKEGKKTLIVDSDPQANLTSCLIEESVVDDLLDDSGSSNGKTIYSSMLPIIKSEGKPKYIKPFPTPIENLHIVPGDIKLAEFEEHLSVFWGECFRRLERGYKGTTALSDFVNECATKGNFDYVFYDTGPNIGPLNRVILLDCDYFIVPAACDLYSKRALKSVGHTIANWIRDWKTIQQLAPDNISLFKGKPIFLGFIPQRFKIYGGTITGSASSYISQIEKVVFADIISVLKAVDEELVPPKKSGLKLGEVQDLTKLVQLSQVQGVPLSDVNGGNAGQKAAAEKAFSEIAKKIIKQMEP